MDDVIVIFPQDGNPVSRSMEMMKLVTYFVNCCNLHKGSFVLLGLLILCQVVCWPAIGPLYRVSSKTVPTCL